MELFTQATALAALAVVAVQQILKLNVIPVYFANKYPLITNVALSVLATVFVSWQNFVNLVTATDWITQVGIIAVAAAIAYNVTLKQSDGVQAASNKKV